MNVNFYLEMESVKFPLASVRKSRHRQEDFPSHACTIHSCRKRPQVRAAATMANSSCHWMDESCSGEVSTGGGTTFP